MTTPLLHWYIRTANIAYRLEGQTWVLQSPKDGTCPAGILRRASLEEVVAAWAVQRGSGMSGLMLLSDPQTEHMAYVRDDTKGFFLASAGKRGKVTTFAKGIEGPFDLPSLSRRLADLADVPVPMPDAHVEF